MTAPAAARPAERNTAELFERSWRAVQRIWERIPVREPWRVLLPLLGLHWIVLFGFVLSVHHNGWVFYQGGDQIWYWTTSWLMGHGSITVPRVSYGWPLVMLPFSWIGGPGFLSGLPATVLLQVLVLAPIALYCVYDIGTRIGGRVIGYLAALAWTLGPYVVIPLFVQRYHAKYVDQFLPHPLGLTAMADYPAVVLLLVAAALGLRALQSRDSGNAIVAGLAAGLAGGMKPSTLIWPPTLAVLLLVTRRWRELVAFGVGLLPAVAALALWKYRGYGYVPAFQSSYQETRVALGSRTVLYPYDHYVHINWHQLHINQEQLAEFFFSLRVLEVLPLAGAIAVARRSWPIALFLSLWFWGFVVLKGSADVASVEGGSFFRLLLPAAPALILLLAGLPLLIPRVGPRLAERFSAPRPKPLSKWVVAVAAVAFGLVPIVAAAAVTPLRSLDQPVVQVNAIPVTAVGQLGLRAHVDGRAVRLEWRSGGSIAGRVFYRVFISPGRHDLACSLRTKAAAECHEAGTVAATTRAQSFVDRPAPGWWTYRVGVAANYLNDPAQGDVFLVSQPVTVAVP